MMNTRSKKQHQTIKINQFPHRIMRLYLSITKPVLVAVFLCLFAFLHTSAQTINSQALAKYANWPRFAQISAFYSLNGSRAAWVNDKNRQKELISFLKRAAFFGLNEKDYQAAFFSSYREDAPIITLVDSLEVDVRFTDAAIHFFSHLKGGNAVPSFGFDGLKYSPDLSPLVPVLKAQLEAGSLSPLLLLLQPGSKEYAAMLEKLAWFQGLANDRKFTETPVITTVADSTNLPLLERLYQLGITDTVLIGADKKKVQTSVKNAQRLFFLTEDGVPGRATLAALNKPLRHPNNRWTSGRHRSGPGFGEIRLFS